MHTKSAHTACKQTELTYVMNNKSIIKKLRVSCWTAYILQDDTRSLQHQVKDVLYIKYTQLAGDIMLIFLRSFNNLLVIIYSFKLSLQSVLHEIFAFELQNSEK